MATAALMRALIERSAQVWLWVDFDWGDLLLLCVLLLYCFRHVLSALLGFIVVVALTQNQR